MLQIEIQGITGPTEPRTVNRRNPHGPENAVFALFVDILTKIVNIVRSSVSTGIAKDLILETFSVDVLKRASFERSKMGFSEPPVERLAVLFLMRRKES